MTEQVQDDETSSGRQKEQGTNFYPVKEASDCHAELVSASLVKNGYWLEVLKQVQDDETSSGRRNKFRTTKRTGH